MRWCSLWASLLPRAVSLSWPLVVFKQAFKFHLFYSLTPFSKGSRLLLGKGSSCVKACRHPALTGQETAGQSSQPRWSITFRGGGHLLCCPWGGCNSEHAEYTVASSHCSRGPSAHSYTSFCFYMGFSLRNFNSPVTLYWMSGWKMDWQIDGWISVDFFLWQNNRYRKSCFKAYPFDLNTGGFTFPSSFRRLHSNFSKHTIHMSVSPKSHFT